MKKSIEYDTGLWFFDSDSDGHWYLLPSSLQTEWFESCDLPEIDRELMFNDLFDVYRIDGHPNRYLFHRPEVS